MKTLLLPAFLALVACSPHEAAPPPVAPAGPGPHDKLLLEAARDYREWGRVDDEARWAPELCRMPKPSRARFSASEDVGTHGRKLYFLFAKDRKGYVFSKTQPASQIVVKESWVPKETKAKGVEVLVDDPSAGRNGGAYAPYASRDGKLHETGAPAGLYIMAKVGGPETDEGWIYGTVTPDGKVTAAGRVASCMGCHRDAGTDRLFGLSPAEPR